ncbi:MAG: DUF1294 domain-containing protein [Stenotrophomonas sp.]
MRYQGRLSDWNDDRGFGFVLPKGGGERAFVHIKAFSGTSRRPANGELISYLPQRDGKGRLNARAIRFATQNRPNRSAARPRTRLPRITLALCALLALAALWAFDRLPSAILLTCAGFSLLAVLVYAHDKSAARRGQWRTPEHTLHLIALLGGWPGALLAQGLFQHKSAKTGFRIVFWLTVVANLAALALWLGHLRQG